MYVPFDLDTAPPRGPAERPDVGYATISPGYLHTLAIALKQGRDFTDHDNAGAPLVALINEAFAALHFPNQDPVGRQLLINPPVLGQNGFTDPIRAEIVGVAGNVKLGDLSAPPEPILYVPLAQNIWSTVTYLRRPDARQRARSGGGDSQRDGGSRQGTAGGTNGEHGTDLLGSVRGAAVPVAN